MKTSLKQAWMKAECRQSTLRSWIKHLSSYSVRGHCTLFTALSPEGRLALLLVLLHMNHPSCPEKITSFKLVRRGMQWEEKSSQKMQIQYSTRGGAILWTKTVQYEGWCHIVDEAFFAPNGGQFQMQISFAFPSRLLSEWSLSIKEMWKLSRKSSKVLFSKLKLIKKQVQEIEKQTEIGVLRATDVTDNGNRGFDSSVKLLFFVFFRFFSIVLLFYHGKSTNNTNGRRRKVKNRKKE